MTTAVPIPSITLPTSAAATRLQCPKCDRTFEQAKGLGSHLARVHNIAGKSSGARAAREASTARAASTRGSSTAHKKLGRPPKRKAVETKSIQGPPFACPECGKEYGARSGLGIHRQAEHGIEGTSVTVKYAKQQKKDGRGGRRHMNDDARERISQGMRDSWAERRANGTANRTAKGKNSTNGATVNGSSNEEFHIGAAFGHTQAWLENYALAAGLSPAILAGRVAELLRRSSMR